MTRSDFLENLADSSAALVQDYDLTGVLVRTIALATKSVAADGGGLLVLNGAGDLELLSATSHAAVALETYQAFSGEGPCHACLSRQQPTGFTRGQAAARWPTIADLMESAGFEHVLATPMLWRGTALGGLNLFWADTPRDLATAEAEAQVFTDLLTLFVVNSEPITPDTARERVEQALAGRAVVEQAKGVLAELEGLDMEAAFRRLRELADGSSLTEVARSVILSAQQDGGLRHGQGSSR
jgi:hypothetical protein